MIQGLAIFIFQTIAHLSLVYWLIFQFSWAGLVAILFFYFLFTAIGSDATYHRLLAHNSFKPPRWFFIFGNLVGTLGGAGSGIAWVANHRAHHRHVDTELDPHSPLFKGWFRVQFLSMFEPVNIKYAIRLLTNNTLVFFHKFYWGIHLGYFLLLYFVFPEGIITMYLAPAALNWTMSSLINNVCHMYGYRVAETNDHSFNNFLIAVLSFGEGWHNYHHANPTDSRCGHGKWELDPVARIIEWVRI